MLMSLKPSNSVDIVVVDNNSKDSPQKLVKKFPEVTFLFNKRNKGYGAACNQGVLHTKGDWLFFLNPDLTIDNETIKKCAQEAVEKNLDAASPQSKKSGYNKPVPSLASLFIEFSPLQRIIPQSFFPKKTLFGGALLIKRNVFMKLKGWDERFFVWFEDSDITKRLMNSGAHIGQLSIEISHIGGESFKNLSAESRYAYFFHSLDIYLKKHHSRLTQKIIGVITQRFWKGNIYPKIHEGISMVVPNMRNELLHNFLKENKGQLHHVDEWIVVSSSIDFIDIWKLREQFPEIRFIALEKNDGFAATVNVGMRVATGKYIGTCNDDVLLTQDSFSYIEKIPTDTGSINPIIFSTDETIESAGIIVLPKGKAMPIKIIPDMEFQEVDATNGACVVYTRKALELVGLFDENFGSYLEDIDLSLRISRAGYGNYVHNASHITHRQHQTSKKLGLKKQWWDFKNWILVICKNWSLPALFQNAPAIFVERLRNISGIIKAI
jgi:GT2 family glycosyltransferase